MINAHIAEWSGQQKRARVILLSSANDSMQISVYYPKSFISRTDNISIINHNDLEFWALNHRCMLPNCSDMSIWLDKR